MSNAAEVVGRDVPFGFCTIKAICGSSKSRFGLVMGQYRLSLAYGEVQADCVSSVFRSLALMISGTG